MRPTDYSVEQMPTNIIRTETVLSKFPIHNLAKKGEVQIAITQYNADGALDLQWEVSYNNRYGPSRQLAYKLDTLVVNRCLDTLDRPLPKLIRLGSLREICAALRLTFSGRTQAEIKHALHQNAGAYITAKLSYTGRDGTEQCLETGFTRYSVIFTGQRLPNGLRADAVYLALNDPYWEVLHHAPVRPLDYEYLTTLTPSAQRFYELLSYQMFAALKHRREEANLRYSTYCTFAPQRRYLDYDRVKKQMYKVHRPHLQSGYLAAVRTERVRDDHGEPDWLYYYTPGPKSQAQYQAVTRLERKGKPTLQITAGTYEPEVSICDESEDGSVAPSPTHNQTDPAIALVQQFYQDIHGVSNKTPHLKEIEHARGLLHRYGSEFASFFLKFAQRAVRQERRTIHVFGGVMRYEASALAAYQGQEAHDVKKQVEASAEQKRRLLDAYDAWLQKRLSEFKEALPPEQRQALRAEAKQRVCATPAVPAFAREFQVGYEVDTQLMQSHGLPSFDVWCGEQEEQHAVGW